MYSLPAGSTITNGDTSDASDLNTPLQDIATDLNTARPVVAGGTGATTASAARTNLGLAIGADVQAHDAFLDDIAALTDPGADRLLFWDDSAGDIVWLEAGTGLSISGTTIATTGLQASDALLDDIAALTDPNADRLLFWDDSAGDITWLTAGSGLTISGTTISATDWTESAVTATTSGTAIDFTSLPSGIKEIEIWFDGVSGNSTDDFLVQIGTGGSPTTSGYTAGGGTVGTTGSVTSTAGFPIFSNTAAYALHGAMRIYQIDTNDWVASYSMLTRPGDGVGGAGGGSVTLSGTLDNIRVTSLAGTQTFDAGQMRVRYR